MDNFTGFKIASLIFISLNYTHSATVNRFGLFIKLPGTLLSSEFELTQIIRIDRKRCLKKCMLDKKCLSVAFSSERCILYSTDPRVQLSENSIVRTSSSSSLTIWVVSIGFHVPCFVGAYRASDVEICGLGQKLTDSNCSEWSDWSLNFVYPCDDDVNYAQILKSRSRARNCTTPIFGGKTCGGTRFYEEKKYAVAHFDTMNQMEAEVKCNETDKAVFTGLFWYTENKFHELGLALGTPFWTGFQKHPTAPISDDTKYSDPSGTQYVTGSCMRTLWECEGLSKSVGYDCLLGK